MSKIKIVYKCTKCQNKFDFMQGWEYPKVCPECGCAELKIHKQVSYLQMKITK